MSCKKNWIIDEKKSAPLRAWKCNFSPFEDIMTDQPRNRPTDIKGHREVGIPISYLEKSFEVVDLSKSHCDQNHSLQVNTKHITQGLRGLKVKDSLSKTRSERFVDVQ